MVLPLTLGMAASLVHRIVAVRLSWPSRIRRAAKPGQCR